VVLVLIYILGGAAGSNPSRPPWPSWPPFPSPWWDPAGPPGFWGPSSRPLDDRFIAGAGIVVRNSIILVDFIELRLKQGMDLAEAVIDAGAVRFRPMMLTAAAVIVGASVILFDPIFQGLAISLMAGEVASLLLSRMTVPILYYLSERRRYRRSKRNTKNSAGC